MQGLLGPVICQQLGQEALDNAVTQTAGLLPRDLQALAADAAAAAAARGLDTLHMLPQLTPLQSPRSEDKLLGHSSQVETQPRSLLDKATQGQKVPLEGQLVASDGQQQMVGAVEVCEADVQVSLDRVRQRTAATIGAPKVGNPTAAVVTSCLSY